MSDEIWDAYNLLMLGPDRERLRKLFAPCTPAHLHERQPPTS
jgi:hypothetical protein